MVRRRLRAGLNALVPTIAKGQPNIIADNTEMAMLKEISAAL